MSYSVLKVILGMSQFVVMVPMKAIGLTTATSFKSNYCHYFTKICCGGMV